MRFLIPLLFLSAPATAANVTLQNGQTGTLGDQKLIVLSVKDSRCPINARCIRAGELVAKVLVSQGNRLRLLTLQFPEAPNTTWTGLRISAATEKATTDHSPVQVTFSNLKPGG